MSMPAFSSHIFILLTRVYMIHHVSLKHESGSPGILRRLPLSSSENVFCYTLSFRSMICAARKYMTTENPSATPVSAQYAVRMETLASSVST